MSSASSSIESDFDDRFLRCFGLGESESSSKEQGNPHSDREEKLRIQSQDSPWLVSSIGLQSHLLHCFLFLFLNTCTCIC